MPATACDKCRRLKYKCERDAGEESCKRCLASGSVCEAPKQSPTDVISPKFRKRKDDSRIDSLEQSVDQLTAIIASLQATKQSSTDLLTDVETRQLFDFCRYNMLLFWQTTRIPLQKTYDQVLEERPILHEAMIAAAAQVMNHPLAEIIFKRAKDKALKLHIEDADRSMQLLQALLMYSTWATFFDKETTTRNGTFATLALQVASEMEPERQDDWDENELSRAWVHIYLGFNSLRVWQAHAQSFTWSMALQESVDKLSLGDTFEKNIATMPKLLELAKKEMSGGMKNRQQHDAFVQKIANQIALLDVELLPPVRFGTFALHLATLEVWSDHVSAVEFEYFKQQLLKRLQDLYTLLDDLVTAPLDGITSFLLIRPLIALVTLSNICSTLNLRTIFDTACIEVRARLEVMGMLSHFAGQLPDKIEYIVKWYGRPKARVTPLEIMTTLPDSRNNSVVSPILSTDATKEDDSFYLGRENSALSDELYFDWNAISGSPAYQ